jgi:hypothetical protein
VKNLLASPNPLLLKNAADVVAGGGPLHRKKLIILRKLLQSRTLLFLWQNQMGKLLCGLDHNVHAVLRALLRLRLLSSPPRRNYWPLRLKQRERKQHLYVLDVSVPVE